MSAAARLAQLVRLCASPSDGEAVAALRATARLLKEASLDFHWLADVAEREFARHLPSSRPSWQLLAAECLRRDGAYRLKAGERQFLISMAHWPTQPSDKQMRWLEAIAAALGVERCAA